MFHLISVNDPPTGRDRRQLSWRRAHTAAGAPGLAPASSAAGGGRWPTRPVRLCAPADTTRTGSRTTHQVWGAARVQRHTRDELQPLPPPRKRHRLAGCVLVAVAASTQVPIGPIVPKSASRSANSARSSPSPMVRAARAPSRAFASKRS